MCGLERLARRRFYRRVSAGFLRSCHLFRRGRGVLDWAAVIVFWVAIFPRLLLANPDRLL